MLGLRRKEQQQNNPLASFATYLSRQRNVHEWSASCMAPEQWPWLLCSVSVIPENKLLLQLFYQLIGNKLLVLDSLKIFGS